MKIFVFLGVFVLQILVIKGNSQFCVNHESCDKCLNADFSCAWCTDRHYDMRRSRCMTREDLINATCREKYIHTNKHFDIEYDKNEDLRDYSKARSNAVQIKPQQTKIKLSKAVPQTIKFTYKPAKNYPLDLYYLMDLTWSMKDDKETLVNVGGSLSTALRNLTENYRLGFGSFADKPVMPFIIPGSEKNPCASVRQVCEPTYDFKHRLSLTDDVKKFVDKVNSSDVTANLDNLEGGMDALMQVIVCEQVAWSKASRKIVVLATDGLMHFAGDGILAGITKRNDKKCHLDESGNYMAALQLDYPSLEEIYHELIRTKISVIFAVTSDAVSHYDQIHELMPEISNVGVLSTDSSNILQLVENGYKEVVKRVQFDDNAPDFIKIEYKTDCGGKYDKPKEINKCDNIEIGKEYQFEAKVTLLKYPDKTLNNLKVRIEEAATSSEFLDIDIQIENPCIECTDLDTEEDESSECKMKGKLICGVCECKSGYIGKTCECNLQNYNTSRDLENQCRAPVGDKENVGEICSDRGECYCGECYCNADYAGKYCEFNDCPYINGQQCGDNHGVCIEGTCQCKPEWSGENCDCSTITSTCTAPNDLQNYRLCSGHGACSCGRCECDQFYLGNFCESSLNAEENNGLCVFYEECVKCVIDRKLGNECDNIEEICSSKDGIKYDSEFYDSISDEPIQCITRIKFQEATCEYHFSYENSPTNSLQTILKIQDRVCPPVNYAIYGLGAVAIATILLGLILIIIFKINIVLADRREYAKFEEEQKRTQYALQMSPIYKSPISEYKNPFNFENTNPYEQRP